MADKITNAQQLNKLLVDQKQHRQDLKSLHDLTGDDLAKELEKIIDLEDKLSDLSETISELRSQQTKLNMAGEKFATDLGRAIGLSADYNDTMLGSVTAALKNEEALGKMGKQLEKTFTIFNAANSIIMQSVHSTLALVTAQDDALVSFNKATGATRKYGSELLEVEDRLSHHGITMDIASEAMGSMVKNVHGLSKMTKLQRSEIADTTAILDKFGVAADTTTSNIQFMTRSLGMSTTQSTKYQREMFTLAQEIGMPPAEMADQFKSAGPKLAAFGKQAGQAFKKLAVAARASGMEVDQLLGIVEKFDTFDSAAQSVGTLNAMLGGPFLNSMEMVMQTDPTERMKMLSGALNKAGKSFDQMSYYERKAIADAAGLSDVSELALVMAGNFDGMAGGAHKSQAEIQKLAAESKEFNTIMEEFNQVLREFATNMKPLLDTLKSWLQWFQDIDPWKQKLILGLSALVILAPNLLAVFTPLTVLFGALGKMLKGSLVPGWQSALEEIEKTGPVVEDGSESIATGIENVAGAAAEGAKGILVLSLSLVAVGLSIGLAAYGVSFLVAEFAKMDPPKILASAVAIGAFGASMYFVTGAMAGLGTVGMPGVLAIIAIGAAFALAAFGVAAIVQAFTELFAVVDVVSVAGLLTSMTAMVMAFNAMPLAVPGMIALSLGIGAISLALSGLDTTRIQSMTALFTKMNEMTGESAANVLKIGKGMGLMSVAMLNPAFVTALVPILAATTGAAAVASTTTGPAANKTFSSEATGLSKKSGGGAGTGDKEKWEHVHKIELTWNGRGFEAAVTETASKQTNVNNRSPAK